MTRWTFLGWKGLLTAQTAPLHGSATSWLMGTLFLLAANALMANWEDPYSLSFASFYENNKLRLL